LEHLAELERDFVKAPDETAGKAYLDKLRDQLTSSSDGARQLMAELHAVHFLGITTRSIANETRLATVRAILSWMAVPPAIPEGLAIAMGPGLYHPGQWALTRRDTQITWLIEFSRRFKHVDAQLTQLADQIVAWNGQPSQLERQLVSNGVLTAWRGAADHRVSSPTRARATASVRDRKMSVDGSPNRRYRSPVRGRARTWAPNDPAYLGRQRTYRHRGVRERIVRRALVEMWQQSSRSVPLRVPQGILLE
jgi:hypothetical protein